MNFSALRASTLPGLLVDQTQTRPDRVAYRSKELGVWRETTWRQYAERVAAVAVGFVSEYGIGRGETVAIVGNPCPEWTIADLAAQALGAITYGIYPTSAPGEVRHLLQHGGASLIVAEDQEHLDKTLEVLDECPNVRAVLVIDIRALFMYRHPRVRPLAEVEGRGREMLAAEPDALGRLARSLSPDAPATIIYTSGTTGHPKGAIYHAAMRVGRRALDRRWSERRPARAWALLAVLARVLVFRWLLEKAGFARVELVISSGAPLPAPVATLWQAWGVNLCEAYGQTETGGALVSGQRGPYPVPGDVGVAAPNMAVELDADGEILVTTGEGFGGYWRDPDATEALYRDGKLATGDVGEWTTERSLRLVDRKRDILITAGGKNVSLAHVENRLRASPYVSEASVFAEGG